MNKTISTAMLLTVLATTLNAQSVIIDRPAIGSNDNQFSVLAGESDRFSNFQSANPADYFVLEQDTTLDTIEVYADVNDGFNWSDICRPGISLHILNDNNGQPDGFPFDTQGEFGSDGVVHLFDMRPEDGSVEFISPSPSVRIDVTAANGGQSVTLPAGAYWLTVVSHATCVTIGEQGHWRWKQSAFASGNTPYFTRYFYNFSSNNSVWFSLPNAVSNGIVNETQYLGGSMAWQMTGETVDSFLLGDVNMDGMVNLLDVAPFVDLISNGEFQAEADINEDGEVNLLDVGPFVDLLSN